MRPRRLPRPSTLVGEVDSRVHGGHHATVCLASEEQLKRINGPLGSHATVRGRVVATLFERRDQASETLPRASASSRTLNCCRVTFSVAFKSVLLGAETDDRICNSRRLGAQF